MKMVIGGAFQGKSAFAQREFPEIDWVSGEEICLEELMQAQGVLGFHLFIRKELKAGRDVSGLAERMIRENPEVILVSDEIGYGVVPIDAFDRAYREAVGRVCTRLAEFSDRVVRVVCGIGTVIKEKKDGIVADPSWDDGGK